MAFKECPAVETRLAFETYTWGMSFPCQPTLVMEHELLFPVRNTYEAFSRTHFPSLHLRGDAVRRRAKQTAVRNGGSVDESGSVSGAVVAALALFVAAPRCLQVRRPARRSAPRRYAERGTDGRQMATRSTTVGFRLDRVRFFADSDRTIVIVISITDCKRCASHPPRDLWRVAHRASGRHGK